MLRFVLPPEKQRSLVGDLEEEFLKVQEDYGPRTARVWYAKQVFRSMLPLARWVLLPLALEYLRRIGLNVLPMIVFAVLLFSGQRQFARFAAERDSVGDGRQSPTREQVRRDPGPDLDPATGAQGAIRALASQLTDPDRLVDRSEPQSTPVAQNHVSRAHDRPAEKRDAGGVLTGSVETSARPLQAALVAVDPRTSVDATELDWEARGITLHRPRVVSWRPADSLARAVAGRSESAIEETPPAAVTDLVIVPD
jgi:hypothetical protein